jgi:ferredoxin
MACAYLAAALLIGAPRIAVGADESILEAIERASLKHAFSCRDGQCGTCETAVLAGRPDHRDAVMSNAEKTSGGTMMICVSRSLDPLLNLILTFQANTQQRTLERKETFSAAQRNDCHRRQAAA